MLRSLSNIPVIVACIALFALMVMTFCDVILRSLFNAPIEAATELTRIFMAIVVFSVMPYISAKGQHIEVDLTDTFFARLGIERARDTTIYLVCGLLLLWPMHRVWALAERMLDYGDVTEYLAIPQFYISGFIAISLAFTSVSMLVTGLLHAFKPSALEASK
ncbi:MAG: C4-dicarboxylate ABC transporter permease [Sneathiella sp.]|nr:MAG: C4-dicarboxylate ABC transporter permease [Sneathiella sp.]